MKKLLIGLLIFSSTAAFAQHSQDQNRNNQNNHRNVPSKVQSTFQQDYPNAHNTQWKNANGEWHGTYKDENNRDVQTHYRSNGQRIDTHISYGQNDLPEKVRTNLSDRYHEKGNYKAYKIERNNSTPLYQVRRHNGQTIYMDENGNKKTYRDHH